MMTDECIKVLIVDDHELVREGLGNFLALFGEIVVVGVARDGQEAVDLALRLAPDVILMDLVMPVMDGIAATERIVTLGLDTHIIALTTFAEEERVLAAVRAGAAGYLLKDVSPRDLVAAIRDVYQGEAHLHPKVAKTLMGEFAARADEPGIEELTGREREVLGLLGQGMTNHEIAATLGISQKTVKTHISHVLKKLHLADRTQAALYAVKKGLA
jgi:NarL family two-component system response regulator LiaR